MSFQLKDWFFTITGSVNKRGTRFKNGDRPNETTFKNLVDSSVFKSEVNDRAKEDSVSADVRTLNGHVVASTSDQAKAFQDTKSDRTLATQPHQLPQSKDAGDVTMTFDDNTIVQNFQDVTVEVVVDGSDINAPKRNVYKIGFKNTFSTWLRDQINAISNYILNLYNIVSTHTTQIASIETTLATVTGGQVDITEISPIGSMMPYAGISDPDPKWLIADGRSLLRVDYPSLFALVGTSFGQGNTPGVTFALPNTSNRMILGIGALSGPVGTTGGANSVTLANNQIPQHVHPLSGNGATAAASTGSSGAHGHTWTNGVPMQDTSGIGNLSSNNDAARDGNPTNIDSNSGNHSHPITLSGNTGTHYTTGQSPVNILNPYLAMNFVIKAK